MKAKVRRFILGIGVLILFLIGLINASQLTGNSTYSSQLGDKFPPILVSTGNSTHSSQPIAQDTAQRSGG